MSIKVCSNTNRLQMETIKWCHSNSKWDRTIICNRITWARITINSSRISWDNKIWDNKIWVNKIWESNQWGSKCHSSQWEEIKWHHNQWADNKCLNSKWDNNQWVEIKWDNSQWWVDNKWVNKQWVDNKWVSNRCNSKTWDNKCNKIKWAIWVKTNKTCHKCSSLLFLLMMIAIRIQAYLTFYQMEPQDICLKLVKRVKLDVLQVEHKVENNL